MFLILSSWVQVKSSHRLFISITRKISARVLLVLGLPPLLCFLVFSFKFHCFSHVLLCWIINHSFDNIWQQSYFSSWMHLALLIPVSLHAFVPCCIAIYLQADAWQLLRKELFKFNVVFWCSLCCWHVGESWTACLLEKGFEISLCLCLKLSMLGWLLLVTHSVCGLLSC